MPINLFRRLATLSWQEWRRFRFSPIWMLGLASAGLLAWSETDSSNVLGYPTRNQALYGFQLGTSVVFGFVAFLLAAGSLAMDLEPSRKPLIFSRPVSRAEFILAKFLGVFSLSLTAVLTVLVFCAAAPLVHGYFRFHDPRHFVMVLALCTIPTLAYVTALALALTALFKRVILVLPVFVLYFFIAALLNPTVAGGIRYLDFSQRLYPRELMIHVPLALREYTFAGILAPHSPDLLARSACYALVSLALLAVAWLALRFDLADLVRWWRRSADLAVSSPSACNSSGQGVAAPDTNRIPRQSGFSFAASDMYLRAPVPQCLGNELTLLHYSGRMLIGRNLLATTMIVVALLVMIITYRIGAMQTRAGVLLLQLELFAPLLGIVMFSDLVATEFEARRADLLRVSRHGAAWVLWRKLLHGALFSTLACLVPLIILRALYCRFDILAALGLVLPGVFFFGAVGLVAASTARRALAGYAAGTAAMVLSMVLKQVEPLTPTSFSAREQLANGRLFDEWNWLIAKVVFVALAAVLAALVLWLLRRPELVRRVILLSGTSLLVVYAGLHIAWSDRNIALRPDGTMVELEVRGDETNRISRQVLITKSNRKGRDVRTAELVDAQLFKKDGAWETQRQTPVDLTRELEIPHLDVEATVNPADARIDARAQFPVNVLAGPVDSIRFYLGWELQLEQVLVDGLSAQFQRYADLVQVKLPDQARAGQVLKVELHYSGNLVLPQNLGFECATKDFMFVTARWYPCLRGTRPGVRPLLTCTAKIHTPPNYHLAAGRLVNESSREKVFLWQSGARVEAVPLCLGTFDVYEKAYRDDIRISFCTVTARKEYAERMLERTVGLLRSYEAQFGPYPYRNVAIVEHPFQDAGGAASSSIVTMKPERLVSEHESRVATAYLPHELAHLWFGNNVSPWIAESCAVYANYRFLVSEQGKPAAVKFLDTEFYPVISAPETTASPLVKAEGTLKYTKGGYLLKMLGELRGDEAVLSAMKTIYLESANLRRLDLDQLSDSFIGKLKSAAGLELEGFVEDMTRTVKRFDPAITGIRACDPARNVAASIELQHFGEMRFPVPVIVNFADGTTEALVWTSHEEKGTLRLNGTKPIASAEIDPENNLLDWDRANNRATEESLLRGGQQGPKLRGWKTFTVADGLPDMDIRCVTARERVWTAAWSFQAAVNRRWAVGSVSGERWEPYTPKAEPIHLVTTLAASPDNSLWFGSQCQLRRMRAGQPASWVVADIRRGGPIGAGAFFPSPHAKGGPPGSQVYTLLADSTGRVWVGTDRGAAFISGGEGAGEFRTVSGLEQREVLALAEDASGTVWSGTDRGLYKVNREKAELVQGPDDLVLSVAPGEAGEVWCGTFRSGLWQVNRKSATSYSYVNAPIPDTIFSSLARDLRGRLYAGSPDGLICFDGSQWLVYTRQNSGLPSNRIHSLALDSAGQLWLGTDAGLTRLNPDQSH